MVNTFIFLLLLLLYPFSSNSISFQKTRFDATDTSIIYEGGATASVGSVEFNSDTYICQVGRVAYAQKVPLWDPRTRKLTDFSNHFTFYVDVEGRTSYAAGFAFFLSPVGFHIPPNSAGGFLGLFNITTSDSPRNQLLHIEFDSFPNQEWDPQVQHVGINNNSIHSATYTYWNTSLHSGDTADVWINYNATTKNLSVSWKYEGKSDSQENTSLSYIIDLRDILPNWVQIGFTAATSSLIEKHVLQSWEFSSSLDMKETKHESSKNVGLVVGLSVSISVLMVSMVLVMGIFWIRKKKKIKKEMLPETMNLTSINEDLERGAIPRRFSYGALVSATKNFSNDRKLGEGGFGSVYKGYLTDLDMPIAVKKISRGSKQGKKEYLTEVRVISRLRHRNLVQLIGWCHEGGELLLVYEFMTNGSLDYHLFGKKTSITWPIRYRIARGLASALLYLHEEWEQCVVHRDVKSSNIMLDSSFNVKLGDFGLARLMDHELGPQTTALAGTLGYLAPEYVSTGRASKEADIYSFGIVALEIATGKKANTVVEEKSGKKLVEWIWDVYGDGKLSFAMDERLGMVFDEKEAVCLMTVGLWCAYPDYTLRPSIRQAIQALNFETVLPNLPAKMPIPFYDVPSVSGSCSEPLMTNSSIDEGR
ncbi:Concanavalin A-like lectin protein kinase family protein [Euphorbia peplus]|nr:Concanavalin A-like lectin protein kinase family protein [Euphorbia peplus]